MLLTKDRFLAAIGNDVGKIYLLLQNVIIPEIFLRCSRRSYGSQLNLVVYLVVTEKLLLTIAILGS